MKIVNKTFKKAVAAGATVVLAATMSISMIPANAFAVTQSEIDSAAAQVNSLNDKLDLLVDQYNTAMNQYDSATAKYEKAKEQIKEKEAEQKVSQGRLGNRAVSMYKNGTAGMLEFVLGSASFSDMSSRMTMLNTMNESDANLISEVKTTKSQLEEAKNEYAQEQANASAALADAASQKSSVETQQASYKSQLQNLKDKYGQEQLEAAREANYKKTSEEAAASSSSNNNSSSSSSSGSSSKSSGSSSSGGSSSGGSGSYSGGGVVGRAQSCLGKPYVYGAAGPNAYDCSGLVSYALTGSYGHRYVSGDFWSMSAVSDPQPGDVCACSAGHCGIYIGNGQMIHAPHTGAVVCVAAARGKIVRP